MNANHFQEVLLPMHIKLQGLYREKCGDWDINDEYVVTGNIIHRINTIQDLQNVLDNQHICIFIPRTIDDSSPEAQKRSLWGMVDWSRFDAEVLPNGKLWIANRSHHVMEKSEFGAMLIPTEAILRALLAQEGIEK